MNSFQSKIEELFYSYLNIDKPKKKHIKMESCKDVYDTSLLPTDLEAVSSPESERREKSMSESLEDLDKVMEDNDDDFESPAFEPLEGVVEVSNAKQDDSHLSGLSNLTSEESVPENDTKQEKKVISSFSIEANEDSQLSQVSSGSRLSIVVQSEKDSQSPEPEVLNITEEAQMPKFSENSNSVDCKDKDVVNEQKVSVFDFKKEEIEFKGPPGRKLLTLDEKLREEIYESENKHVSFFKAEDIEPNSQSSEIKLEIVEHSQQLTASEMSLSIKEESKQQIKDEESQVFEQKLIFKADPSGDDESYSKKRHSSSSSKKHREHDDHRSKTSRDSRHGSHHSKSYQTDKERSTSRHKSSHSSSKSHKSSKDSKDYRSSSSKSKIKDKDRTKDCDHSLDRKKSESSLYHDQLQDEREKEIERERELQKSLELDILSPDQSFADLIKTGMHDSPSMEPDPLTNYQEQCLIENIEEAEPHEKSIENVEDQGIGPRTPPTQEKAVPEPHSLTQSPIPQSSKQSILEFMSDEDDFLGFPESEITFVTPLKTLSSPNKCSTPANATPMRQSSSHKSSTYRSIYDEDSFYGFDDMTPRKRSPRLAQEPTKSSGIQSQSSTISRDVVRLRSRDVEEPSSSEPLKMETDEVQEELTDKVDDDLEKVSDKQKKSNETPSKGKSNSKSRSKTKEEKKKKDENSKDVSSKKN